MNLESLTDAGIPKTRLSDPEKAFALAMQLKQNESRRDAVRGRVQGLVDGNPPWSPAALAKSGRKDDTNINFRQAEAFIDSAKSPLYDLFSEAQTFATAIVRDSKEPKLAEKHSGEITKAFHELLAELNVQQYLFQVHHREMIMFGKGPIMFDCERTLKAEPILERDLLVPPKTKCDTDRWDLVGIRRTFSPAELYRAIEDEAMAREAGWNVESVRKTIRNAHPKKHSFSSSDEGVVWSQIQEEIRANDLYFNAIDSEVKVIHLFFREFPDDESEMGKISHVILADDTDHQMNPVFLYQKIGKWADWKEFLFPFYYDMGDGTHHGVKGMGVKFFAYLDLQNRLTCATVDGAFDQATTYFQVDGEAAMKRNFAVGRRTIMPMGVQLVTRNVSGVLEAPLTVVRKLEDDLSANLSQYRTGVGNKSGNPRTAEEIKTNFAQQGVLQKSVINRYYDQLDDYYRELFRRIAHVEFSTGDQGYNLIQEFKRKMKEAEIPASVWKKALVSATRIPGQGSALLRQQSLAQLGSVIDPSNEEGITNWRNDMIAALSGQSLVNRYNPNSDTGIPERTHDHWEAHMENLSMRSGAPPMIHSLQNDVIHADAHSTALMQAFQAAEQGGDLRAIVGYGEIALPHIMEHLLQLEKDEMRKSVFEALREQWGQLAEIHGRLKGVAIEQMRAEQKRAEVEAMQGQQLQNLEQQKQMAFEAEQARKNATAQADIARKNQKAAVDLQLKDAKTAAAITMQNQKTQAQMGQTREQE